MTDSKKDSKKKVAAVAAVATVAKKGGGSQSNTVAAIGGVSVSCAPGTGGMKNVTVTATGVTAPLGSPATCSLAGPPVAVLKRGGVQVGSQTMNSAGGSNWTVTFFNLTPGNFSATVFVNWNILLPRVSNRERQLPLK